MPFSGSIVALITPFTEKNKIDEKAIESLLLWHIENQTDGVVCCGTTGESMALSDQEKLQVIKICVDICKGKMDVIAGTGSSSTHHTCQLTEEAQKLGVNGSLIIVPYYNRPTDLGCLLHFQEIAKVGLDMIIYENPARTSKSLSLDTFTQFNLIPSIKGIKVSVGSIEKFEAIQKACSIPLLSGDDHLTLEEIKKGAVGAISVIGNLIPKQWKKMIDLCFEKKFDHAQKILDQYQTLLSTIYLETNPQMVKYGVFLLNKCLSSLRLPLLNPIQENKKKLEEVFQELNIR